jgi:VanZ family protein
MPRFSDISARARIWLLFTYWTLMFLMTHLPGIDRWHPRGGWFIKDPDKYVHFFAFAGWVWIWAWLLDGPRRRISRQTAIYLFGGGIAYATFDELTQSIVGRTPGVDDWALDVFGLLAGLIAVAVYHSRRAPREVR